MSTPAVINAGTETRHYTRFTPVQRMMHVILLVTFLGLAATGLPMRFSNQAWVAGLNAVGGFAAILFVHKLCAVILSIAFMAHVADIFYRAAIKKQWWLLWGPNSLVPNLKDVQDFIGQMKWFLFRGPKPVFDRYTYWEKLDYWGVFWGMAIIGISGYAMWFAPAFARLVPGSWLNVALLIHGEEALLATGFIFVVHFFNEHLRPDNFPMDITVFTGRQTEAEFQERHPIEYARLLKSGELEQFRAEASPASANRIWRVFGTVAVVIGLALIALIIMAVFTAR